MDAKRASSETDKAKGIEPKIKSKDSHTDTWMRRIQEDEKCVMQKVVIKWCSLGENYLLNAKYLKLSRLY